MTIPPPDAEPDETQPESDQSATTTRRDTHPARATSGETKPDGMKPRSTQSELTQPAEAQPREPVGVDSTLSDRSPTGSSTEDSSLDDSSLTDSNPDGSVPTGSSPIDPIPDSSSDGGASDTPLEPVVTIHRSEARIRRAPKIPVFIVLGALVGALATVSITLSFPIDETVGLPATVGYFLLYGIPVGMLIGALVAIVLDRISARRVRNVTVERTVVDPLPYDDASSYEPSPGEQNWGEEPVAERPGEH